MTGRSPWALVVWVATMVVLPVAQVRAGCDAIPPAAKTFGSTLGAVDRAIAGPRDWVTIVVNPSCPVPPPIPTPPRSTFAAGDRVTIDFDASLLGAPTPPTGLLPVTVEDVNVEIDPADPHRLRFRVPTTVMPPRRPQGLTGPVRITVKTPPPTPQIIAQIDALWEPTTGCDRNNRDQTFGNFTILPEDNDYDAKETSDDFIDMTLDGQRDLLIPFRYARIPVSSRGPVAFVQRGFGAFPSGVGNQTIAASLLSAVASGAPESSLARPYSPEGFPLPPVVGIDDGGGLFGTTDAPRSVLRIARTAGARVVHDLTGMLTNVTDDNGTSQAGVGPIVLSNSGSRKFRVYRCTRPALLSGLKGGQRVTAFGVDEGVEKVGDLNNDGDELDVVPAILSRADTGTGKRCASSTGIAAAEQVVPGASRTLLDVRGELTAFLGDTDGGLHVFRGKTTELTSNPTIKVDGAAVVNGARFVVAGTSVFFRKAAASASATATALPLLVFDAGVSPPVLRDPGVSALEVAVDPGQGTAVAITVAPQAAQFYDGAAHSLTLPANHAAVGGTLAALTVPESSGTVTGNGDGDTNDDILVVTSNAATTAPTSPTTPSVSARAVKVTTATTSTGTAQWVLFVTAEADEGPGCFGTKATPTAPCDLNGDGDADDLVLRVYDPATGTTTAIQAIAGTDEFVTDGAVVAFRTSEIVLPSGQISTFPAPVMTAYDLAANRLVQTGLAALRCTEPGYEWMQPYAVRGRDIYFLRPLTCCDPFGRELDVFNIDALALQPLTPAGGSLPAAVTVTAITGAQGLEVHPAGGAVPVLYGDRDGDGILDGFDRCVDQPDLSYFDDDLDGLGTACDSNACTQVEPGEIVLPKTRADRHRSQRFAVEAGQYATTRLQATTECLKSLAQHDEATPAGAGPTERCRGYFVDTEEVPPADRRTAERIAAARNTFFSNVRVGCRGVDRPNAERMLQRYAEAAIAVSHAAFGDVELPIAEACATQLVEAANAALSTMVTRADEALKTHGGTVSLGRIGADGVQLNGPATLAVPVPSACEPGDLQRVSACAASSHAAADCLACIAFRRVTDALTSIY